MCMGRRRTERTVRWIERGLMAIGLTCLLWAATTSLSALVYQVAERGSLARLDHVDRKRDQPGGLASLSVAPHASSAIGRLEIPRLGLSVVVAEGDDEHTLKMAVGHLPDTPFPWQDGNTALAGHRDTFFRLLRHIQVGDEVHLATRHGTFRYRVTRHMVVDPEEIWVLDASPAAALTLITCHPFDFIGSAPRRFVVHAARISDAGGHSPTRSDVEDSAP
jgi:sortase A